MVAAILRAQLLSMRRRGVVASSLVGLLFYGFWATLAVGVMLFFASPANARYFVATLSSGLLFAMLYWQFAPVLSASLGASLDLRKLLAYPIPHRTLFLVEVLLRITACAEMLLVLLSAALGLMRNPLFSPKTWPAVILGALLFAATNIFLSAGTRNLLERVFLRSRLKEVVMILLMSAGLIPQILIFMNVRTTGFLRFVPSNAAWPWGAVARLMLHQDFGLTAPVAVLWLAAACSYSRWQFDRSLRYDASNKRKPGRESARTFRLPARFLADPIAALVEKELRTLARIPRCRMVFAMSCFFGLVFLLPSARRAGAGSFLFRNGFALMGIYGLLMLGQITYWNAFGFEREAVQGYFSWPIRFRDALIAKNVSLALLVLPQLVIIAIIVKSFRLNIPPGKLAEGIAATLIAALYWCAMGNIASVRMPRPMNPEKMNQMSSRLQALSIFTAPLLLFPLALAYWALFVFKNEWIFAALLVLAAIIGGIFYWLALDSAAGYANRNRELLIAQLSRSDGPVSMS